MVIKSITIFLALVSSTKLTSQNIKAINIESKALKENRDVLIRLPDDYSENVLKSYPVLITLNDKDNFYWASSIVDIQASRYGVEDMIVVGLPHAGNYSDDNFPFKEDAGLELNPQAQKYSEFIREEALTYIEDNYRTNNGRFIIGHSLSGLFVLQLFLQHPESFSSYIVLSPSVHYAPQLSTALSDFLAKNKKLPNQLFISLGEMEHSLIKTEFKVLSQAFEKHAPRGLNWKVTYLDNTDHLLSAYKGTYDGLAWIYKDWYINESKMLKFNKDNYIAHYKSFEQKLGYNIKPRKNHLLGFSWFAEEKLKNKEAAIEAIKTAIYFYPKSGELKNRLTELEK